MKYLLIFLLPLASFANSLNPTPFPVFLKSGFSAVLDFDESPTRVVLGDAQIFKVEKLEHSLVVKTLLPYATTNMFVYFRDQKTKLFILTASEDAEPTYYKKFETFKPVPVSIKPSQATVNRRALRIVTTEFDSKKDFLIVNVEVSAGSGEPVKPNWPLVRLKYNNVAIVPNKLWSERKEVQRDSRVRARFVFSKPNISKNLKGAVIVLPVLNNGKALTTAISGVSK